MRTVLLAALLAAFWLLLSGFLKPLLLIFGVLSVGLAVYAAQLMRTTDEEGMPIQLIGGFIAYLPWLLVEIVKSSWSVAQIVLDPKLPISPTMTVVKGSQQGAVALNVYANSITLTPGTITVEIDDNELLVHALLKENADDLEEGGMDRRVSQFEGSA
ncbi:MAG: Na+/H+ antiporter subunit E [Pseudomonadota bacterium]